MSLQQRRGGVGELSSEHSTTKSSLECQREEGFPSDAYKFILGHSSTTYQVTECNPSGVQASSNSA